MEGPRGRKHGLKVLSALDNGPAAKKSRETGGVAISQWRQTQRDSGQRQEPRQRPIRTGKRKKMPNSRDAAGENDENQCHDLEESVKRLRIRPFVFSITSFIEQTVDSVSFNFGDGDATTPQQPEPELVVVLPLPFRSSTVTYDP